MISSRLPATPYRSSSSGARRESSSSSSHVTQTPKNPFDTQIEQTIVRSLKRTLNCFASHAFEIPPDHQEAVEADARIAARDQYSSLLDSTVAGGDGSSDFLKIKSNEIMSKALVLGPKSTPSSQSLVAIDQRSQSAALPKAINTDSSLVATTGAIIPRKPTIMPKPVWHPPWKLMRVISSHTGWVRSLAIDPTNEWFASGGNDRLIKIWDLARGSLKVSLTGHISPVRGLAISSRHPYLFSCGEDKTVKCWDLEKNMVIRHYHGHLSGVYCLALHPVLDILVTGGRDNVGRVWDMRTKVQIHALSGHTNSIASVQCQEVDPQVITGSHDSTIRMWDLIAGKTLTTLTHHKKSIRALELHPKLKMFASGAADNIKQWVLPEGKFVQNLVGQSTIINCMAINEDNILVSGGDEGSIFFWDWKTGYNFQQIQAPPQPGSLDSERGIYEMIFDKSGSRLITGEADKSIKIYKVDEDATEETHPVNWKPEIIKRRRY
ncbi:transport and golgi organization 4 [Brevipalpus obovatus]|uniref:transport and golgi organization 4 n=1 Tax=Brevipalpus obovatus TaxID=246614 RepID=UPI003D9EFDE3